MSNSKQGLTKSALSNQTQFKFFTIVVAFFIATWLTSDIAAIKLISVWGITLTGGFIIFPFTTMFGSIIVEVYGYKNARQAIWAGFILNVTFIFFINIVYLMPSSSYWVLNNQFREILLPEIRIVIASIISFLICEFVNSYLMAKMKIKSQGRSLAKRIIVSCGVSFLFDIVFFLTLAFYGSMPNSLLVVLIFYAYLKKVLFQALLFPIFVFAVHKLKVLEGREVYDYNTNFLPFSLDNVYEIKDFSKIKLTEEGLPTKDEAGEHVRI
jgi:uncharacterized integral membrane protein (TIGR00697 family)